MNSDENPTEPTEDDDEPISMLAGLRGGHVAPEGLASGVEDKIRERSDGRFFGPSSLADKKPLAVFGLVVLLVVVLVSWLLRDAPTGSIPTGEPEKPEMAPGAEEAVPTP